VSGYVWSNWSDGLGQSHILTCTGPETLTAYFKLQYRVTMLTSPNGLLLDVDGILRTTPYEPWWDDGSVHTLGAPSPQDIIPGSSRYDWRTWNDAGARYHDIAITGADTYIASFILQYKITITSDPAGLEIMADGIPYTAPYEVWWDEASSHSLDVRNPQVVAPGERYVFNSWSDAQPKSHTIIVAMSTTYTAYMDHQFEVTFDIVPVGGITVTIDGTPYTTPGSFWWDEGSTHSVSATEFQDVGGGVRAAFASWRDGGGQSQKIIADGPETLAEDFSRD